MLCRLSERTPIVSTCLSLLLGPAFTMAYLGQWVWSLGYVAIGFMLPILSFTFLEVSPGLNAYGSLLLVRIVGALHVFKLATTVTHPYPWYARWYSLIFIFLIAQPLMFFTFQALVLELKVVQTEAMEPTLRKGDVIVVSKSSYGFGPHSLPFGSGPHPKIFSRLPNRGDVVLFEWPSEQGGNSVMRIVGLPGDEVQMKDGTLFINGQKVHREQIEMDQLEGYIVFEEVLPSGVRYLTRVQSNRSLGYDTPVHQVPIRHFFVLGDNRRNSLDSRFELVGYVMEEDILGKVIQIIH